MLFKRITFILSFLISNIAFGQVLSQQYNNLIKKADSFYRLKNYKNSALTYSLAFKTAEWKVPVNDRYNAACVWALANYPDSAFFHLNHIVINENYTNYAQISADHDLISLSNDKRWKPLLALVEENIKKKEARLNKSLIKQLDSIHDEDQKYRQQIKEIEKTFGRDSKEMLALYKIMHTTDSVNLIKVRAIIDSVGWLGPDVIGQQGNATLFLVIQHSDQKTQEKYLPILREAVKNKNAYPADLALLEDRVLLGQGKKQIYGSQILKDSASGKNIIAPIEDEANVDKRRADAGLQPLEEYAKHWGIEYKSRTPPKPYSPKSAKPDLAVEIQDSITGPTNVSRGDGSTLVLRFHENNIEEENSIWFKFSVGRDTILTFDIVPEEATNDYDFALFKCSDPNCINNIRLKKVRPDRYCLSANEIKHGATGLSEYSRLKFIGPGPGSGYASSLPVKAGETYYLMINYPDYYWKKNIVPKGFTLYFYNYWPNKPVKKKTVVLENVLFETNKATLLKESFNALDKLVKQLQVNKTMKIEIIGHTDNTGDENRNQQLSENRAKAVVNYLISKKIDANRLSSKGFGSKKPLASNDTEEGRKMNRRVEFSIINK